MGRQSHWKKPKVKCVFHSNQFQKITRLLQGCKRSTTQDLCFTVLIQIPGTHSFSYIGITILFIRGWKKDRKEIPTFQSKFLYLTTVKANVTFWKRKSWWGYTLCVAEKKKKSQFIGCLWLCTETQWELRPEPTSANYAFSDLKHTNADNCELSSLSPPNHPFSPPLALSP